MIYSASSNSFYTDIMYPRMMNLRQYSAAWSPDWKGMLIFGGIDIGTNISNNDLLLYHPTSGWRLLETKGTKPPPRRSHCFVPAYSGSKMILFGGIGNPATPSEDNPTLGDLYILDVRNLNWTRGGTNEDAGKARARWGHACATSGDHFIAWGGSTSSSGVVLNQTIVYNLKTTWTDKYEYVEPPRKPTDKKVIIIACSVAGGVLLILVATALIVCYRRAKRRREVPNLVPDSPPPFPMARPLPQAPPRFIPSPFEPTQQFGTPPALNQSGYSLQGSNGYPRQNSSGYTTHTPPLNQSGYSVRDQGGYSGGQDQGGYSGHAQGGYSGQDQGGYSGQPVGYIPPDDSDSSPVSPDSTIAASPPM